MAQWRDKGQAGAALAAALLVLGAGTALPRPAGGAARVCARPPPRAPSGTLLQPAVDLPLPPTRDYCDPLYN